MNENKIALKMRVISENRTKDRVVSLCVLSNKFS